MKMLRNIAIAYAIFAVAYAYEDDHDDHWDDDHEEGTDFWGFLKLLNRFVAHTFMYDT